MELLDQYAGASEWTVAKAAVAANHLDAPTPCEGWDVRKLMNHMLQTQQYFVASARGQEATPPGGEPPELLSDDPAADFEQARTDFLRTFGEDGVVERTGPVLGIAFADQLLHGWDLARATDQDATMPERLAEAAYGAIHGKFSDDQRAGTFGPEILIAENASAQDMLLAYTGRDPSR
ncbi:MAG: TIGR03086 family metal-binding protein [Marmoricola sp.]